MTSITSSGEVYRERPKKKVEEVPNAKPIPTETHQPQTTDYQPTQTRAPLDPQEKLEHLNPETDLGKEAQRLALKKQREKLAYVPQADGTMKPVKEEHLGLYERTNALLAKVKENKQTIEEEKLAYKQDDDGSFVPVNPEEIKVDEKLMIPDSHENQKTSKTKLEIPEHLKDLKADYARFEGIKMPDNSKIEKELEIKTHSSPQTTNQQPITNNQLPETDDIYVLEKEQDLENITESGYALLEKLGTGGQGEVYRAKDLATGEEVAIKYGDDLDKEVLAKKLNHPNITRIKSSGEDKKGKFIVREYVKGKSLAELLKEGKLSYEKVLKFGKQIVEAVKHLHENDIVYGDLKPENVLVSEDGESVKITDFGLSRDVQTDGLSHSVKTTTIKGTPKYMAPERIKKGQKATKQSDVYELGELLFEMLTGDVLLGPDDERLEKWREIALEERYAKNNGIVTKPRFYYTHEELEHARIGFLLKEYLKSNPKNRENIGCLAESINLLYEQHKEERKKLEELAIKKLNEFDEKEKQEAKKTLDDELGPNESYDEINRREIVDRLNKKEKKRWTWSSVKEAVLSFIPGYGTYKFLTNKNPDFDENYRDSASLEIVMGLTCGISLLTQSPYMYFIAGLGVISEQMLKTWMHLETLDPNHPANRWQPRHKADDSKEVAKKEKIINKEETPSQPRTIQEQEQFQSDHAEASLNAQYEPKQDLTSKVSQTEEPKVENILEKDSMSRESPWKKYSKYDDPWREYNFNDQPQTISPQPAKPALKVIDDKYIIDNFINKFFFDRGDNH